MKLENRSCTLLPCIENKESVVSIVNSFLNEVFKTDNTYIDTIDDLKKFADKELYTHIFEHIVIYLKCKSRFSDSDDKEMYNSLVRYYLDSNSHINEVVIDKYNYYMFVTTTLRSVIKNGWLKDINKYVCEKTENHNEKLTYKFVCQKSFITDLVKKLIVNKFSLTEIKQQKESELTFIVPKYIDIDDNDLKNPDNFGKIESAFYNSCIDAENIYNELLNKGLTYNMAKQLLPQCIKTELLITGYKKDINKILLYY